ncbi:MAG: MucR family transcriptional regulator [Pseudomonadota bacterium]
MPQSNGVDPQEHAEILAMTTQIVSSYVSNNPVQASGLPELISSVHATLDGLSQAEQEEPPLEPAVPVAKSITGDYIICLEDGKKLKMLKRYIRTRYNLTPDEYRARWGLPPTYPMVAPNYAAARSTFAKNIGLGKKKAAD